MSTCICVFWFSTLMSKEEFYIGVCQCMLMILIAVIHPEVKTWACIFCPLISVSSEHCFGQHHFYLSSRFWPERHELCLSFDFISFESKQCFLKQKYLQVKVFKLLVDL